MTPKTKLALGLAALAALFFFVGQFLDSFWIQVVAKPVPVLLMAGLVFAQNGTYARRIGWGLIASALGDVLLELGPSRFLWGVGAFFIAHVFYLLAFFGCNRRPNPIALVPMVIWIALVFPLLRPGLAERGLTMPVALYVGALGLMVAWAIANSWAKVPGALSAVIGAALFAASDSLLALDRFHEPIAHARFLVLALYWAGQLGLTWSALGVSEARLVGSAGS